jgi:hypothetical protein
MPEKTVKALVHAGLAALAFYESTTARTNARRLLLGCAVGWHVWATFAHIFEVDNERRP